MEEEEWAHLRHLVTALERGGNRAVTSNFERTEGGYECVMNKPLDFAVLRQAVGEADEHVHLAESSDMLWCSHCWAAVVGPRRIAEAEGGRSG